MESKPPAAWLGGRDKHVHHPGVGKSFYSSETIYISSRQKRVGESESGLALGQAHSSLRKKCLLLWISCGHGLGKRTEWRLLRFDGAWLVCLLVNHGNSHMKVNPKSQFPLRSVSGVFCWFCPAVVN